VPGGAAHADKCSGIRSRGIAMRYWLVVEAAAAALKEKVGDSSQAAVREATGAIVDQGADEALCRLWDA
jgi:hypothetical protein